MRLDSVFRKWWCRHRYMVEFDSGLLARCRYFPGSGLAGLFIVWSIADDGHKSGRGQVRDVRRENLCRHGISIAQFCHVHLITMGIEKIYVAGTECASI